MIIAKRNQNGGIDVFRAGERRQGIELRREQTLSEGAVWVAQGADVGLIEAAAGINGSSEGARIAFRAASRAVRVAARRCRIDGCQKTATQWLNTSWPLQPFEVPVCDEHLADVTAFHGLATMAEISAELTRRIRRESE